MRGLLSTFTVIPVTALVAVGATVVVLRPGPIMSPDDPPAALPAAVTPASTLDARSDTPVAVPVVPIDGAPARASAPAPPEAVPQPDPRTEPIDYLALTADVRRVSDTLERFNEKLLGMIMNARGTDPDPDSVAEAADDATAEGEGQP